METRIRRDDAAVAAMNELLRGELSAVETYDKALPAVEDQPALRENLQACRTSHELRVETIRRAIVDIGGAPAHASGAWGVFAKTVAGGARALGWKAVIATLEDGEDVGLAEYEDTLPRLDENLRRLVASELVPEQRRTHGVMAALKRDVRD